MNTTHEYGAIQLRTLLRKLRNLIAVMLMVAAFAQFFGVPKVIVHSEQPRLRLVRLERPVWVHVRNAAAFLWARLFQENQA